MPNAIVEKYRSLFPEDQRSDEAIVLFLGDRARSLGLKEYEADPDFRKQYLDLKVGLAPSIPAEFKRSLAYGTDMAQAKLYDTAALAGSALGIGPLERFGQRGYERNLQESAGNEPTIQDIADVRNVPEAFRYGTSLVGSQVPQLGGTLGGAVSGGAAGFAVGGPVGAAVGAGLGGGAAGFTQMQNYGELIKQGVPPTTAVPVALGVGGLGALLETLVPAAFATRFFRGASTEVVKRSLANVLAQASLGTLAEGGTEVLQEVTTIAGEQYANRNNPNYHIDPDEVRRRLINAGAAGGILGAGFGGAAGMVQGRGGEAILAPGRQAEPVPEPDPAPSPSPAMVPIVPLARPGPAPSPAPAAPDAAAPGAVPAPEAVLPANYQVSPEIMIQLNRLAD